ncbi:trypsin-like peptidase domain-containing protein [Clostridium paridis]|uniref:Serine protease n=1 Tax=Clostridium paridis TaxID=2803863 RepID=A0A937FCA0_9CLOT|nr:trypsin-like peptidase domain-containing protein [Clostridium paridis]MBL4930638.1 serine protease [Clostridium paridis]
MLNNNEKKDDIDVSEKNEQGKVSISVKKNKRKIFLKVFALGTFLILLSVITGIITSQIIINKKIKELGLNTISENDYVSYENVLNNIYLSKVIKKTSVSLVTISDNKENLNTNKSFTDRTTGVIIDSRGYIATSFSSIKDLKSIYVGLSSPGTKPMQGKLIGEYEPLDIAIIKIEGTGYTACELDKDDKTVVGDRVVSIGHPLGTGEVGFASFGVVTSNRIEITINHDVETEKTFNSIQSSTIITKDNNGGPLCNLDGEVIGISSLEFQKEHGENHLSVVVGGSELVSIIEAIIDTGNAEKIKLGFIGGSIKSEDGKTYDGVYVESVIQDSNIAKAGIGPTDIIKEVGGEKINTIEDLDKIIKKYNVGDNISCKILRSGQLVNINLTI